MFWVRMTLMSVFYRFTRWKNSEVAAWHTPTCLIFHPQSTALLDMNSDNYTQISLSLSWNSSSLLILFSRVFSPSIHFILSLTQPGRRSIKLITSLAAKTTNYFKSLFFVLSAQIPFASWHRGEGTSTTSTTGGGLWGGTECQWLHFLGQILNAVKPEAHSDVRIASRGWLVHFWLNIQVRLTTK